MAKTRKPKAIIPREAIEPARDEIRLKHPDVTDFQMRCIELVIHLGLRPSEIAKRLNVDVQKVTYHIRKPHVQALRQELALAVLGWDASVAQATLIRLLHSRSEWVQLEAAKDIVARAGLSVSGPAISATAVQINFGLAPAPAQPVDAVVVEPIDQ